MSIGRLKRPDLLVVGLKAGLIVLAVSVVTWGLAAARLGPVADLDRTADSVARGAHFDASTLDALIAASEPMLRANCDDAVARDLLVVKAYLFEAALEEGAGPAVDRRLQAFEGAAKHLLACSPLNSFGWLGLFVSRLYASGFDPKDLPLLRASYRFGPHELWVEARRNFFAMRVYDSLPDDLRQRVREEFRDIVRARAFDQAAAILTGVSLGQRTILLVAIADLPGETRARFQNRLKLLGLPIDVPGVEPREDRPWSN